MTTLERLLRLLLMLLASLSCSPVAPDRETFSEPAKSTRFKVPAIWDYYRRPYQDQVIQDTCMRSSSTLAIYMYEE